MITIIDPITLMPIAVAIFLSGMVVGLLISLQWSGKEDEISMIQPKMWDEDDWKPSIGEAYPVEGWPNITTLVSAVDEEEMIVTVQLRVTLAKNAVIVNVTKYETDDEYASPWLFDVTFTTGGSEVTTKTFDLTSNKIMEGPDGSEWELSVSETIFTTASN